VTIGLLRGLFVALLLTYVIVDIPARIAARACPASLATGA